MSTLGAYHDECGVDIMNTLGDIMSTPGVYHDECGDIISTVGVFSTLGGYHEYTGGCSVHRGIS